MHCRMWQSTAQLIQHSWCVPDRFKYRNVSGTILAPTNGAFRNFSQITGLELSDTDDAELLLRSVLAYHILFAALPVSLPPLCQMCNAQRACHPHLPFIPPSQMPSCLPSLPSQPLTTLT